MSNAITIIDLVLAPAHIIMIGPKATFGKEFNIVKNGSNTSAKNFDEYINILTINAIDMPIKNATNTSMNVTPICLNNSPLLIRVKSVFNMRDGLEKINELITPVLEPISHKVRKSRTKNVCVNNTFNLYFDI